jgi:hypothetical protein
MLSFETARDVFALIGVAVCLWHGMVWFGRGLGWIERAEIDRQEAEAKQQRQAVAARAAAPAPTPMQAPVVADMTADHVVAIAAAVAAMGGVKLVTLADPATGHAWVAEGRWLHQTSHRSH